MDLHLMSAAATDQERDAVDRILAVEPGLRTVLRAHDPSSVRPHDLIDTRNRKERAQAS